MQTKQQKNEYAKLYMRKYRKSHSIDREKDLLRKKIYREKNKEKIKEYNKTKRPKNTKRSWDDYNNKDYGLTKRFKMIKERCNNQNSKSYKWYGARGIKVLWNNYAEFRNDMLESYIKHLQVYGKDTSIDRIDVNGNYCKENCRWSTNKEQQNNKRKHYKNKSVSLGK